MKLSEQENAVRKFVQEWSGRGYEKGETHAFWLSLLRAVFGIQAPEKYIHFEDQVQLGHTSFIDAYIPETKVMIEQKGKNIDLNKAAKQSDGQILTPYQQAKRYADELEFSKRPRWIVVCNFQTFHIHDMEHPHEQPLVVELADLPREFHLLSFLIDTTTEKLKREMALSIQAGDIVGQLYDEILKLYKDPKAESSLKSLNKLCVRLVFCLYAEDAGIFGKKSQFHDYLIRFDPRDLRRALIDLFEVLDTPVEKRDPYLDPELAEFPYVNGGLFRSENESDTVEIPRLDDKVKNILLTEASNDFDWSNISPTIFGAVFESTLNPETRRSGGMHYTSIENIHKVIDPLFLDALKDELNSIKKTKVLNTRKRKLENFQEKLASLNFLDPACGSGNFLTETYLSLRRMENEVLSMLNRDGHAWLTVNPIQVSIGQFFGIEINDFAVSVAKTALWIAESQMMKETEAIVHRSLDFLPLRSYANIVEGNALRIDWNSVIPKEKLNYIMGNPPFLGARLMGSEQKAELTDIFEGTKNSGNLDYVCCWYKKAADCMQGTAIRAALVSTNSITQGEQVAILWKPLFKQGIRILFAYRTFRWDSEAKIKAHVHCVIIGFAALSGEKNLQIFDEEGFPHKAHEINPYLIDAPIVFIESRSKALCNIPEIGMGNQPIDGGNYLFTKEEMLAFTKQEPASKPYFKKWFGAIEFIARIPRYCLWLGECPTGQLLKMPECLKRVQNVRQLRLDSKRVSTKKLAETPTRFQTENMPKGDYLLIPSTSSEKRAYIPIGFMSSETMASNATLIIPNATLYHFGVLTSSVHMAWMRTVCGRLEMRYRYSKDIVYNNFPWPEETETVLKEITKTAQEILDARNKYPDCSFADLYGESMFLFPELLAAHQANDRAVLKAYGFSATITEPEIVAELMKLYQKLTAPPKA